MVLCLAQSICRLYQLNNMGCTLGMIQRLLISFKKNKFPIYCVVDRTLLQDVQEAWRKAHPSVADPLLRTLICLHEGFFGTDFFPTLNKIHLFSYKNSMSNEPFYITMLLFSYITPYNHVRMKCFVSPPHS